MAERGGAGAGPRGGQYRRRPVPQKQRAGRPVRAHVGRQDAQRAGQAARRGRGAARGRRSRRRGKAARARGLARADGLLRAVTALRAPGRRRAWRRLLRARACRRMRLNMALLEAAGHSVRRIAELGHRADWHSVVSCKAPALLICDLPQWEVQGPRGLLVGEDDVCCTLASECGRTEQERCARSGTTSAVQRNRGYPGVCSLCLEAILLGAFLFWAEPAACL